MTITQTTLHRYFQRYGWEFQQTDDPNTVITGYEQGEVKQALAVVLGDVYVAFSCPLANFPYKVTEAQKLLRLNYDLPVSKISLDDELSVTISVELPVDGFGYDEFVFGLEALMQGIDLVRAALPSVADGTESAVQ